MEDTFVLIPFSPLHTSMDIIKLLNPTIASPGQKPEKN